jgi:DNA invertase Pin-like site-specific DNA recombinase
MATMPLPFQLRSGRPRRKVDAKKVIELRAQGHSWRAIGRRLRVGTGTALRAAQGRSKIVP